jgi:CDP-diacylglycerol--serine O-phosphatidyltransferase
MAAPWWWRYAIPNVVTCASLLAGLLAISSAIAGDFHGSAWLILLSVLLDKLDGTAARLLKGSSQFGLQMDSLTDMIVFGVAPAVLVLAGLAGEKPVLQAQAIWLPGLRYAAYIGAFWYVIAAALRLAKFNVVSEDYGKQYFFGVPTTVCGAFVASFFLVGLRYPWLRAYLQLLPVAMFLLGFSMVSRVPLPKLRAAKTIPGNIWVFGNVAAVYTCGLARLCPEYLLAVSVIYMLVGSLVAMARGVKAPPLPRPGQQVAVEGPVEGQVGAEDGETFQT